MTKTRDLANLAHGITSDDITNGAITDDDINASAGVVSSKLAFTQSGTGAEQRTVESKLQDVVSVLDFIPPGTDTSTTDCSPYIQAAINAAGSQKRVYIPGGKYLIQDTITLTIGSRIFGDPGGVTEQNVDGFSEGTTLYLSTTKSDGSTWTTSIINPNNETYAGRVLFCGPPAGGACGLENLIGYSLGANVNNSTFLYCGGTESTAPYERGFVTQFHGRGLRLFTFNRGFSGSRFDDAWLEDCHSELVTNTFVVTAGTTAGWGVHMANCLWWRSSTNFQTSANVNISIHAVNCVFTQNEATSTLINNGATGTTPHKYYFDNCAITTRVFARDVGNVGGNLTTVFSNCNLSSSSFLIVEEGATRGDVVVFDGCTLTDYDISLNYKNRSYSVVNNSIIGDSIINLKGASNGIIANNNWDLCTATAPLVNFESGVISSDVLVTGNLFNSATDVGGATYGSASQNRVRVFGNRNVPDKEVNYKTPWSPATTLEILGKTVSGNSIGDADASFILRNSNGVNTNVNLLADRVSDVHSTLTFQTAISQGIADRLKITTTGALSPGANNVYNIGDSTNRWKEIFATNGVINTSDERTKYDIEDLSLGLDFIKALRPIQYKAKEGNAVITSRLVKDAVLDDDGTILKPAEYEEVIKHNPGQRIHAGLSAQQVKECIPPEIDFAGWTLADPEDADSLQALRYTEFIGVLIKAIKELDDKVNALSNSGS